MLYLDKSVYKSGNEVLLLDIKLSKVPSQTSLRFRNSNILKDQLRLILNKFIDVDYDLEILDTLDKRYKIKLISDSGRVIYYGFGIIPTKKLKIS